VEGTVKLSRRDFLQKLVEVVGVGTSVMIASQLPELPEQKKELPLPTIQEQALQSLFMSYGGLVSGFSVPYPGYRMYMGDHE